MHHTSAVLGKIWNHCYTTSICSHDFAPVQPSPGRQELSYPRRIPGEKEFVRTSTLLEEDKVQQVPSPSQFQSPQPSPPRRRCVKLDYNIFILIQPWITIFIHVPTEKRKWVAHQPNIWKFTRLKNADSFEKWKMLLIVAYIIQKSIKIVSRNFLTFHRLDYVRLSWGEGVWNILRILILGEDSKIIKTTWKFLKFFFISWILYIIS